MNATSRAYARLAWLSLVLAAAFTLLALVNLYRGYGDWPLKVALGFLVGFAGLAVMSSRASAAEMEAHARLIAAAPELLAALKIAQITMIELGRALPQGEALADHVAVLDSAEKADLSATAAIAKAEGRS